MRVRLATTAAATVALCAMAGLPAAAATRAAAPPPAPGSVVPDLDPFYAAPANIGSVAPGGVVRSRPVSLGTSGLTFATKAWQIAYRSNDSHSVAELAVTTLVVPTAAWTGTGPRPVVSAQTAEDSVGTTCAPSYTLATGTDVQDYGLDTPLLAKGWAVAVPDFEGPKSVFLASGQAAHAVLDGIRAVKNFGAPGIGATNPWALTGYSGGAEATAATAQFQPSYAPDVKLVGASMGGTPSDPTAVARYIDGGVFAGFEFAAAFSIANEYPEAGIPALLNAQGQTDFAAIKGECETTILGQFANKTLTTDSKIPDPLTVPSVAAVLAADTLGKAAPATPIYNYHANTDEIVPVAQDNAMVANWCTRGAIVDRERDLIGEHSEEAVYRLGASVDFLTGRFAGKKPTNTC